MEPRADRGPPDIRGVCRDPPPVAAMMDVEGDEALKTWEGVRGVATWRGDVALR